jgi:phosphinothricin acetyltransferase
MLAVRFGATTDLPAVVSIYNRYVASAAVSFDEFPVRWEDRLPWLEEHAHGPHRLWVATDAAAEVVGWATSSPFRARPAYRTTIEASVYCRPDRVGQGVGSALYRALCSDATRHDLERIVAGVTLPNPASEALHAKFGLRRVGTFTRVGRKFGRFWNVAWFERPVRLAAATVDGTTGGGLASAERSASYPTCPDGVRDDRAGGSGAGRSPDPDARATVQLRRGLPSPRPFSMYRAACIEADRRSFSAARRSARRIPGST